MVYIGEKGRAARDAQVAEQTARMQEQYVRGVYPTPPAKQEWLDALVVGLVRSGYVTTDHKGRLQITLDFRGEGRAPRFGVQEVVTLNP